MGCPGAPWVLRELRSATLLKHRERVDQNEVVPHCGRVQVHCPKTTNCWLHTSFQTSLPHEEVAHPAAPPTHYHVKANARQSKPTRQTSLYLFTILLDKRATDRQSQALRRRRGPRLFPIPASPRGVHRLMNEISNPHTCFITLRLEGRICHVNRGSLVLNNTEVLSRHVVDRFQDQRKLMWESKFEAGFEDLSLILLTLPFKKKTFGGTQNTRCELEDGFHVDIQRSGELNQEFQLTTQRSRPRFEVIEPDGAAHPIAARSKGAAIPGRRHAAINKGANLVEKAATIDIAASRLRRARTTERRRWTAWFAIPKTKKMAPTWKVGTVALTQTPSQTPMSARPPQPAADVWGGDPESPGRRTPPAPNRQATGHRIPRPRPSREAPPTGLALLKVLRKGYLRPLAVRDRWLKLNSPQTVG